MRVKMQQPACKCEKMQMRAVFVNGPIPVLQYSHTLLGRKLRPSYGMRQLFPLEEEETTQN